MGAASHDTEFHRRVKEAFDELLEQPEVERESRLRDYYGSEPRLARELEKLLQALTVESSGLGGMRDRVHHRMGEEAQFREPPRIEGFSEFFKIGEGGQGEIWRALQHHPHRFVAVKILKRRMSPHNIRRFESEINALATLPHDNIPVIYGAGVLEDERQSDYYKNRPYYYMRLVDGLTIDEYVEARGRSPGIVFPLILQVAEALNFAHRTRIYDLAGGDRPILHRDVKPANIRIERKLGSRPVAILLDFGLASVLEAAGEDLDDYFREGGSLPYMSPEQAFGLKNATPASDVFALAAVAFELLTRKDPRGMKEEPLNSDRRSVAQGRQCRLLGEVSQTYGGSKIERVLAAALRHPTRKRHYHTARSFARALRFLLETRRIRNRRRTTLAAAIVGAGLTASLAWSTFSNAEQDAQIEAQSGSLEELERKIQAALEKLNAAAAAFARVVDVSTMQAKRVAVRDIEFARDLLEPAVQEGRELLDNISHTALREKVARGLVYLAMLDQADPKAPRNADLAARARAHANTAIDVIQPLGLMPAAKEIHAEARGLLGISDLLEGVPSVTTVQGLREVVPIWDALAEPMFTPLYEFRRAQLRAHLGNALKRLDRRSEALGHYVEAKAEV